MAERPRYPDDRLVLAVYVDRSGEYQVSIHGSPDENETAACKALRALAFGADVARALGNPTETRP